jgi:spore coat polysaccharide biosynthesis predicted glycosyltransferase SpsG
MTPQAEKPTIILATSNGVGMGHLARASAIALELKEIANPIIVSMAGGVAEVPNFVGVRCEYIPGRDRGWMPRKLWDAYLRDRLLALIEETDAQVLSFDGVVPYPGVIGAKLKKNDLALVWVRRGLWQRKPQGLALGLQSMMMDEIIEPGDFARVYDHGPTKNRKDAVVTSAVSLFQKSTALDRDEARVALGIDLNRPAVLVQLGTGDSDVNEKMTAALKGLIGWKDLQVVLTKKPIDANGNSLVPEGLEIKQVRFFPLAKVLHAFDAAICATGYNGVHELLPALVPTVFVSNIRGTDDQEARAQWCHDLGYALRADQADLDNITETVKLLQDPEERARLHRMCKKLPEANGAKEAAQILYEMATVKHGAQPAFIARMRLKARDFGLVSFRQLANAVYRQLALVYRKFNPHIVVQIVKVDPPHFGDETDPQTMRHLINGEVRYEHLISGASENYRRRRDEIASAAYGTLRRVVNTQKEPL